MANLLYPVLKKYSIVALHFYFRKWQVNGATNIPKGPVIFVPNHQNAFLDAVLVACSSVKNPWFMTRSDVFKNPVVKKILHKLKMLPVYRFRDGFKTLKNNDDVLNECISKINAGETLLIFSEGSHGEKYQLRPLQRGVARIAFEVEPSKNICIIPVGIQYDFPKIFRSRVLINFGKPIYVNEIKNIPGELREQHDELMSQIQNALKKLMLHIDDGFYSDKFDYLKKHRINSENLVEQLIFDNKILSDFPAENKINFSIGSTSLIQKIINFYTRVNLWIPSTIINNLLLKNVKDPQFGASIKFAAGMVLTPLIWILQGYLFYLITNSGVLTLLYLFSLVGSLWFEKSQYHNS